MIHGQIGGDLESNWARDDDRVAHRSKWVVHRGTGASDAATVYFEIDPGHHIGRHTHDASETILLLKGKGRALVADEETAISPGDVVHVPAEAPHDVVNEGDAVLELLGFFSKAEVVSVFEQVQMPDETTKLGTPD